MYCTNSGYENEKSVNFYLNPYIINIYYNIFVNPIFLLHTWDNGDSILVGITFFIKSLILSLAEINLYNYRELLYKTQKRLTKW